MRLRWKRLSHMRATFYDMSCNYGQLTCLIELLERSSVGESLAVTLKSRALPVILYNLVITALFSSHHT